MPRTAADTLVEILIDWGVDTVFGLPGDGINGIMEALRTRRDRVRFVQVRHEESAALAAVGYAKFSGRLGVCVATSGPGGLHLVNGLYDAKLDGAPVLAITGHHYHDLIDTHGQQDVNLPAVFADVAAYNTLVMGAEHVENAAHLACRTALAERTVSHLCLPTDIQVMDAGRRSRRNVPGHNTSVFARMTGVPAEEDLVRAADVLNAGSKVAILAGAGALGAGDELEWLADLLAAPIIKALLGKAVVPDDSPFTTGGLGLLGTTPSQDALAECDTLLIVGSSFPYIEFLPKPGQARGIQVDIDPTRIGLRYPVEVGIAGDCRETLIRLLERVHRKEDRSFLERAQHGVRAWELRMHDEESRTDKPMKPQVLAAEIGKRLNDDAIVIADTGTITAWSARHVRMRQGQQFSASGYLATMANGLPYAIGAQLAFPKRQVVVLAGDGGLSMLMSDLVTAVKYELPIKVFVFHNNELGQIKWEQIVFLGNPQYGVELQQIDFAAGARACGATGIFVDDPKACREAVAGAWATPGPVVVDAVIDALEAPMPPHVTPDQAIHFAEALVRGQPDAGRIVQEVVGERVRELV
jgi:pyruvate dehydrogenase (quinone)